MWFRRGEAGSHEPVIGEGCVLGWGSVIDCQGQVTIGDHVMFGHRVMVLTGLHDYLQVGRDRMRAQSSRPVTIKDGAWIASGAIIYPGVIIGEHAVVVAGAVVVRSVPAYTMVGGNPAVTMMRLKGEA